MRTIKSKKINFQSISGVVPIWNVGGWTLADRTVWAIQSIVNSARETSLTSSCQLTQLALNSRHSFSCYHETA